MPTKYLTEEVPTYVRQGQMPGYLKEEQSFDWSTLPEPADYNEALLKLMSSGNICSRKYIWESSIQSQVTQ